MSDYINGSNILLSVGGKAIGHCTSHTLTFNSETKERAVKPAASAAASSGLWKGKGVSALSISISADGLRYTGEAENGFDEERTVGSRRACDRSGVPSFKRQHSISPG